MDFKYRREGYTREFDLSDQIWGEEDIDELAESAAEDFWNNHDGFEASWPINFEILTADGVPLGKRRVEQDVEPVFSAYGA